MRVLCPAQHGGGVAFRANDAITLNEAAVVLNRLLRVTDVDLSDYDVQDADNAGAHRRWRICSPSA